MFYLLCKLVGLGMSFAYPVYSSYKAVRVNDTTAVETWLMYWVVMAGLHAAESTVEWAINWFPFYYELKTILIIWLTLPQIQGSTYVYVTYVHPFLLTHEKEIDEHLQDAQRKARAAGLDYARRAWNAVRESLLGAILANSDEQAAAALSGRSTGKGAGSGGGNTTSQDYLSSDVPSQRPSGPRSNVPDSPAQQALSFASSALRAYGPTALAAGHALLRPLKASGQEDVQRTVHAEHKKDDDLDRDRPEESEMLAMASSRPTADSDAQSTMRPPRTRLYSQEVRTVNDRRVASASAALASTAVIAANAFATASGSMYSTMTRAQLRQRRLELEAELAALEAPTTSLLPLPGEDSGNSTIRPNTSLNRERERHISAPTPPRRISPLSSSSHVNLLDSSTYEQIAPDDIGKDELPPDWGRRAPKEGWRGAPPAPGPAGTSTPATNAADRGSSSTSPPERPGSTQRKSWFWSSPAAHPSQADKETKKA